MLMQNPMSNKHHYELMAILGDYTRQASDREAIKTFYDNSVKYCEGDDTRVTQDLVAAIYDGLRFGNWLWLTQGRINMPNVNYLKAAPKARSTHGNKL